MFFVCLVALCCDCCFVNLGKPRIVRSPLSGHSSFPLQLPFFLVVDVMLCLLYLAVDALYNACNVAHAAVADFDIASVENLRRRCPVPKCLSMSCRKVFRTLVKTLIEKCRLNQMVFRLRVLLLVCCLSLVV